MSLSKDDAVKLAVLVRMVKDAYFEGYAAGIRNEGEDISSWEMSDSSHQFDALLGEVGADHE